MADTQQLTPMVHSRLESDSTQPCQRRDKMARSPKKVHFDNVSETLRYFVSSDPPNVFVAEPFGREKKVPEVKLTPCYFSNLQLHQDLVSLNSQPRFISSSPWQPVWW